MIKIKLAFFATLQHEFGEVSNIIINESIEFREILDFFQSKRKEKGSTYFLENEELKKGITVLINGRNILALEGLNTYIDQDCEISFFPQIAGGF